MTKMGNGSQENFLVMKIYILEILSAAHCDEYN